MSRVLKKLMEAIEYGDPEEVIYLVEEALEDGIDAKEIVRDGLTEGMNAVGELFKQGELFVPEVILSANAMETGLEVVRPYLREEDLKTRGKIIFCTVLGDLHDIGKKLCVMMLEGAGYEVIDLGIDIGVEQIVDAVKLHQPDIVAMSAMLTTTMVTMDDAVDALKRENLADQVHVMVGGAPLSKDYACEIDANYSEDAISCVEVADKLVSELLNDVAK